MNEESEFNYFGKMAELQTAIRLFSSESEQQLEKLKTLTKGSEEYNQTKNYFVKLVTHTVHAIETMITTIESLQGYKEHLLQRKEEFLSLRRQLYGD